VIAKESRWRSPIENIEVGEEQTTCIYCGARTKLISTQEDGVRHEECLHCSQNYHVTDAPDNFEPSEMTMKEIENGDRPAEQADFDHLPGVKRPPGWGASNE